MSEKAEGSRRIEEAQDIACEAERRMEGGDVRRALVLWAKVRELDEDSPELAIHEGQTYTSVDRCAEAEQAFSRAIVIARERLGGDEPGRFSWWGYPPTRPYMRARQELGNLYWAQGRYLEAATEYRALLARNPNDNQGARYVIAPLLLFAGDLEGSLREFDAYAMNYGGDLHEPHLCMTWALALIRAGRAAEALLVLRRAFFANLYTAPEVLGRTVRLHPIWHASNLAEPDYARHYARTYGKLWKEATGAIELLEKAWDDAEARASIEEYVAEGRALDRLEDPKKRGKHIRAQSRITKRTWSDEFLARMGVARATSDPMHPPGQRQEPPARTKPVGEPSEGPDGRPTLQDARASGEFEKVLADLRRGVGNPTVKVHSVMERFLFADEKELQSALNLAMQAWNEGVGEKHVAKREEEDEVDIGDPGFWMDDGLGAFAEGEIEGAVDCWLAVVRVNPAIVDRLLLWDDDGVKEHTHPLEEKQAWEYMNRAWWDDWKDDVEAWTAMVVFWCQPEVQRLAKATGWGIVQPGPVAEESDELAPVVRRILEDEGPVGEAWRTCGAILHECATWLRDLDRQGKDLVDLDREAHRGCAEGMGLMQREALLFARDGLTQKQARQQVIQLRSVRETMRGLEAQARGDRARPIRRASSDTPLNAPCPCGSGKKYKRCCGK